MKNKKMRKKLLLLFFLILIIFIIKDKNKGPAYGEDELVGEFISPSSSMKLYIYQGPTRDAVMVDFYVVGEIQYMKMPLDEREIIYYKYHEEFEECYWRDDEHVVINGREVDIKDKRTWIYEEE